MKFNYILTCFILLYLITNLGELNGQEIIRTCDTDLQTDPSIKKNDVEFGITNFTNNWPNGKQLRIRFLDGSQNVKDKVKQSAKKWLQFANVNFLYVDSEPSDVRISFLGEGSWSYLGKNTISYGPTMNFGWLDENSTQSIVDDVVLHEFGHMLGLLHEHKHPERPFEYNIPVVLNHYYQLGWDRTKIYDNVINKYGESSELSNKSYDPLSIMHYPVPENFTLNGYSVGWNNSISEGDKQIISEMYPFKRIDEELVKFDEIEVITGFEKDRKKGLLLLVNYSISNDQNHDHFFDSSITLVSDKLPYKNFDRTIYRQSDTFLATSQTFKNKLVKFIPYENFGMECGTYKLKLDLNIRRRDQSISAGARFFTFTNNCAVIKNLKISKKENETYRGKKGIKLYANFKINDARYSRLDFAIVYMPEDKDYDELSYLEKLGDYDTMRYINIPRDNIEVKDNDFFLFLPYEKIGNGKIPVKFHLVVRQRNTFIMKSEWLYFNPY